MEETEIDIRQILGTIRRQIKLIIGTMVLGMALAMIAVFSITPLYTGTTLILVDPQEKNLLDPTDQGGTRSSDSARVDSEVELVDSDSVLLNVISEGYGDDNGSLITDPEFGVKIGIRDKMLAFLRIRDVKLPEGEAALGVVLSNLKGATTVRRQGLTYLISVKAHSEDPKRAAALSNAISRTYIRNQIEMKVAATVTARDVVQGQIEQAESAVVTAEANFNDFIINSVDTIVSETGREELGRMRDQIRAIATERASAETQLATLSQRLESGDYRALADALGNEAISELQRQREDLRRALSGAERSSAAAVDLRSQLEQIEQDLAAEGEVALSTFQAEIRTIEQRGSDLRSNLNEAILSTDLPPRLLAQIYGMQQVSKNATAQYQTLLSRTLSLETEAALQVADSRIVSPAFTPTSPSSPNTRLILAAAFVLALGAGVAFAFVFENYIGGFTNQDQVEALTRLPVATVIPRQVSQQNAPSVSDAIIESPLSMFAESVRRMRVAIDHAVQRVRSQGGNSDRNCRIIMVSSALPGEGKSTVSLSIARALAVSGFKTLIVDCDLRKPSVHRQMEIEPSNGLADYLIGDLDGKDLMDIVKADPKTSLTAVVGARRSDIPTDQLIDQESFAQLLKSASSRFEYIILDSPPVDPVVDGLYLAKYADVIAFVIRWAKTSQRVCAQSLRKLADAKAPEAQIVTLLNQQEGKKGGYYNAYSDYYTE